MTDPKELADLLQIALDDSLGKTPYVRLTAIFAKELEMVLRSVAPPMKEIGALHRTRDGQVHFLQKEEEMEFPLHSLIVIYASPNAASHDGSKEKP